MRKPQSRWKDLGPRMATCSYRGAGEQTAKTTVRWQGAPLPRRKALRSDRREYRGPPAGNAARNEVARGPKPKRTPMDIGATLATGPAWTRRNSARALFPIALKCSTPRGLFCSVAVNFGGGHLAKLAPSGGGRRPPPPRNKPPPFEFEQSSPASGNLKLGLQLFCGPPRPHALRRLRDQRRSCCLPPNRHAYTTVSRNRLGDRALVTIEMCLLPLS